MLGSPARAPRIWLDPPPAHSHSNGLSRYQLYSTEAEPRVAHLPPPFIQPQHYEDQVLRRSVSQLSHVQNFTKEKKILHKEICIPKPLTGWSDNCLKDGCCSRTTPRRVIKPESARVPTPCQVPEVSTSSKTDIQGSTSGGIPVGIAIARQRVQQTTSPSSPLTVQLTACQDRGPQPSPWPSTHMPAHHYQFRGPDPSMAAIQTPFQLIRDPMSGQFMLLPTPTPALACLSLTEGSMQRAVWTGPPPLQVMHQHPQPQPLLVDRLVTLAAPSTAPDKRRPDCMSGVMQVPCDFSKSSPSTAGPQQSLLIHPTMSPHQAFSTLLVHNMPFAASTANHQNSFLLNTQLTEQAFINQAFSNLASGGVVISNHLENTVINPGQIIGGCQDPSFSPQANLLHHMSPSVVISSHTETNSFVRDIAPSVITAVDNQVIVKSEVKSEPLCTMDQATSPPTMEVKPEVVNDEYADDDEERTTIVADASNQTETPSNSEEEDTQSSVKLLSKAVLPKDDIQEEQERETSVVQQETTQIVTTQITRTTWTTEQTHQGTVHIEQQEEIKEEVEEVVEREQESTGGTAVDLSGLELLSNTTIAQHENFVGSSPGSSNGGDSRDSSSLSIQADMGGLAVLCQAADYAMSQPNFIPVSSSTASSSIVYRSSTVSTSTVSSIETTDLSTNSLSPPRILPVPVEKLREVPLKEAFKVLRAKKIKEKKYSPLKMPFNIEDDSPIAEPPVLEPWSAAPQRLTPPLGPPTLTPNKKRSFDSPDSAEDEDPFAAVMSPPHKKGKVGRHSKKADDNPHSGDDSLENPGKTMPNITSGNPAVEPQKHKIRPKLKAEAMVKEPQDEVDDEIDEPSLNRLSPSWKYQENKVGSDHTKVTLKKAKSPIKMKPLSPRSTDGSASVSPTKVSHSMKHHPNRGLPETKLTESDLKDFPISIMMYSGGHFVLAQVTDIKAPGIYEVIYLRNPRNRRPYILCTEELLSCAIREVKLDNMAIPAGTRVCSYWSQEYNFMYSGVVSALCKADDKFVFVEFDDGDDGKINRDEIRLLPEELNLTDYDPEPSSPLMGRRRRTSDSKSTDTPKTPTIKVKPLRPPPEETDEEMAQELSSPSPGHHADVTTDDHDGESHDNSAASEETSEAGSETRLDIKTIVADFLQKEKKEKRRLKKEKKRRLLEEGGIVRKHKHKGSCRSHCKQNSELRITKSTVSKDGMETGHHKGPLVTTIAKPASSSPTEENKCEDEETEYDEEEAIASPSSAAANSKFAAFLPPRHELWTWRGDGSRRGRGGGLKRGRKTFYKAIQRGSDVISVGDCAVFVSTGRPDRPFIGQVESLWGTQKNNMLVKVAWFYHPEETVGAPEVFPYPGALFKSPHTDSNDVQTISHRCEVVSLAEFKERVEKKEVSMDSVYDNQEVYYLAGYYDPQDTSIKYEPGIVVDQK